MKNCIRRSNTVAREFDFLSRIEIVIEAGEIAAGNFQAQRMAAEKNIARAPEIDADFVDLSRVHECSVLGGGTVTDSQDALREILREAVGRNVDQLRGEVRVYG